MSILFILLYLFVAGALFRGMLQDYPYDTFEKNWATYSVLSSGPSVSSSPG